MKLGAKWGELVQLMQTFVPGSHIGIFRNECTQSAPFDPKTHVLVRVHLVSFHNCMKLDAKRGELVQLMQKFVPRTHFRIFRSERTQSTLLDPKLMFRCVFVVFGCIWDRSVTARNLFQNILNWFN